MNPRRLLRNSLFMSGSVVAGGLVLFLMFVLIARYLPVQRFGQFVFVLTLASMFQLFADGGIVSVTIRDLARSPDERERLFGSTRALVCLLTVAMTAIMAAGTALWDPGPTLRATAWCMGAAALMALHGLLYAAVVRAYEDMGTVALASIVHKLVLLLLVVVVIAVDGGIEGVALVHVIANVLQWAFFSVLVRRRHIRAPLRVDFAHWRYLVQEAVPLGVGQVLRRMTTQLGTLLLAGLAGVVAVGLYNSAYRVVQMLEIGAVAATGVLYPVFSRLAKNDAPLLKRLYGDAFRMMLVLSAAVAGVLLAFGDNFVLVLYGRNYAEAGAALRVLGAALVFLMPSAVMHSVFSAIGKQTLFMKLTMLGVLCNGTLGVLLIPRYGSLGAAWATLVTEIVLFLAGAFYLHREDLRTGYLGVYLRVITVMGVLTALGIWADPAVRSTPMLVLACVLYVMAYAALMVFGRIITPKELRLMRDAARPDKRPAV
jgi:O-antigen/teichoic acid export membrane protein